MNPSEEKPFAGSEINRNANYMGSGPAGGRAAVVQVFKEEAPPEGGAVVGPVGCLGTVGVQPPSHF